MGIISDKDQQVIRQHFEDKLAGKVEITLFSERESLIIVPGMQKCLTCADTEKLLKELAALSEKLTLSVHELSESRDIAENYGIDRVPAFVLEGEARGRVRFFGIPSGYEFSALISDIVDTSTGISGLSQETRDYLATLAEDINIKVFTTPT
jgi:alkyl hydroperoxide reductase subunit AhpF